MYISAMLVFHTGMISPALWAAEIKNVSSKKCLQSSEGCVIIKKEQIQMLTDKFRFKEIDAKLLNLGDYDMIFETLMKI